MKAIRSVTRRRLLGGATGIAAMMAALPAAGRDAGASNWRRLRRVVTSYDAQGRTVVLADGEPGNVLTLNGTRITRLWESSAVPVQLPLGADAGASAGNAYRPGFVGTSFYVAQIPGGTTVKDIPMHRNATLDYMAVLDGRVLLKLDDQEIDLRQGDLLIQGGNLHSWENRWRRSCLLLFVVVAGSAS
ncbi:MAG: hypothetical protein R3E77_15525 [Steroidobacteraceae bacterium]